MKNLIYTLLAGITLVMGLQSFDFTSRFKQRDGTVPGHTGSPGDSLKDCTVCHGGNTFRVNNWISSNVPATGFVPGQRYTIRALNVGITSTIFGFQVSPQDSQGNLQGTLIVTDTVKTQLVGENGKYVTYRSGGVRSRDSMVWYFDWIAPTDDTKKVTFWGAFNNNHEGHKPSDVTYLSTLTLYKEGVVGLKEKNWITDVSVYPNPTSDQLHVRFNIPVSGQLKIRLYAINGSESYLLFDKFTPAGYNNQSFDLSDYASGNYILAVSCNGQTITKQLLVNR